MIQDTAYKIDDGVLLSSIVAKETTTGDWSGSGGGVGIGTGGLGLFIGGMSGKKTEKSKRAEEFSPPLKAKFSLRIYP